MQCAENQVLICLQFLQEHDQGNIFHPRGTDEETGTPTGMELAPKSKVGSPASSKHHPLHMLLSVPKVSGVKGSKG